MASTKFHEIRLRINVFLLIGTFLTSSLVVISTSVAGELEISKVEAGDMSACALVATEVYCWGNNLAGALGTDSVSNSSVPLKIQGLTGVTDLSVGSGNACAIKNGQLYCWGSNGVGQLGLGDKLDRSFPTLVPGLSNVTKVDIGGPSSCAVSNGNVYCWGEGDSGQLGIGTSPMSVLSPQLIPNFSGVSDISVATSGASACAVKSGHAFCWGIQSPGINSGGVNVIKNMPSEVLGIENISAISVSGDGICALSSGQIYCWGGDENYGGGSNSPKRILGLTGVTQISKSKNHTCAVSTGQLYCWGDNYNGTLGVGDEMPRDLPTEVPGMSQVASISSSDFGSCSVQANDLSCWGFNYYGTLGIGNTKNSSSPRLVIGLSGKPSQVSGLKIIGGIGASTTVSWETAEDNGTPVTGYVVRTSSDGRTWSNQTELGLQRTYSVDTSGLTSASAIAFQVAAVNSKVQGEWSAVFPIVKRGTKAFNVYVQDAHGHPIVGGSVTWQMADGSAKSSKTYGLTSDGLLALPQAPAGIMNLTLVNGTLPDGSTISGTWQGVLGLGEMLLQAPTSPVASRTIHVTLPKGDLENGLPVGNTKVAYSDADGSGPTSQVELSGFTFKTSVTSSHGFTDANGDFTVRGYFASPQVDVDYDDGTITQHKTVDAIGSVTNVELDYMPWVSFDTTQVTGDAGGSNLLGRHYATSSMPVKAGVAVTILPPKGVKGGKCANGKPQKLSGVTGANGKAKLTICAYKSGIYTLKTSGAASVGSIRVLVKGAAPLAPTSVNAKSIAVGQLRATWNKPLFDGGSPITQYTVTATAKGKPTVTKVIKATVSKKGVVTKAPATLQVITGLSNATVYTVTVTSTTKNGTSDAYSVKVPVA